MTQSLFIMPGWLGGYDDGYDDGRLTQVDREGAPLRRTGVEIVVVYVQIACANSL